MSLDQLMAFTVCEDHARQERVWKAIAQSWNTEPHQIRRLLTEGAVPASDKRAQFVGLDSYEAGGGAVTRDLFQDDGGGWLQDVALLDALVADKLKAEADRIAAEGWKWVEAAASFPFGHTNGLRAIKGEACPLDEEEASARAALDAAFHKLEAEYADAEELPDDVDQRLGQIETSLDAFDNRPLKYDASAVARAGAFVSIDRNGMLCVERGFVRPEDESADSDEIEGDDANAGGQPGRVRVTVNGAAEDEEEPERPLPDRLVLELTAHRTLALTEALASNPRVAFTALLQHLVRETMTGGPRGGCLEIAARTAGFAAQAPDLAASSVAQSVAARLAHWKAAAPEDDEALWTWIESLSERDRMDLLAHCVSQTLNAVSERANPYGANTADGVSRRLKNADRIAAATGLDMAAAGWRPTVDNYLGRVTKHRILEAVREAKGEAAAQLIDHLKKADMAKEAERLLEGSNWLPEPLRPACADADAALPAFLAEDAVADPALDAARGA